MARWPRPHRAACSGATAARDADYRLISQAAGRIRRTRGSNRIFFYRVLMRRGWSRFSSAGSSASRPTWYSPRACGAPRFLGTARQNLLCARGKWARRTVACRGVSRPSRRWPCLEPGKSHREWRRAGPDPRQVHGDLPLHAIARKSGAPPVDDGLRNQSHTVCRGRRKIPDIERHDPTACRR